MSYKAYYDIVSEMMESVMHKEGGRIEQVGQWCVDSILQGGLIHAFGTGHSHMLAEEMFFRAGGLLPVNPIFESSLMLHVDAQKSSRMERLTGLADVLIESEPVREGDVLFVFSNSGRNAVPIEMALAAQKRGLKTVGVTSLSHSKSASSRHPDNIKLYEAVDVAIDNQGVTGDAVLSVQGTSVKAAATSSVMGTFIVQCIVAEIASGMEKRGHRPPIMMSGNLDGATAYNETILEDYKEHVDRSRFGR